MHFLTTRIKSLKNNFLTSGVVNNVFKCISWPPPESSSLKNHFLTSGISRPPLKNYFLTSGAVKNAFLCICAYFQTTRITSLKNYFLTSGVVENVFWCISRPPESSLLKSYFLTFGVGKHFLTTRIKSLKIIFERLEWLKTCFYAFAHTSRPPESKS